MKKTSTFSKVLVLFMVATLIASCGSSKKTTKAKGADFAGNYEWVVSGTPDGDQGGTMTIKKTESGYSGELEMMGMAVPLENIVVEGNKMTAVFAIPDMDISFSVVFAEGGFKGDVYAQGQGFPITGKKLN